jgi:hypothetical protein
LVYQIAKNAVIDAVRQIDLRNEVDLLEWRANDAAYAGSKGSAGRAQVLTVFPTQKMSLEMMVAATHEMYIAETILHSCTISAQTTTDLVNGQLYVERGEGYRLMSLCRCKKRLTGLEAKTMIGSGEAYLVWSNNSSCPRPYARTSLQALVHDKSGSVDPFLLGPDGTHPSIYARIATHDPLSLPLRLRRLSLAVLQQAA